MFYFISYFFSPNLLKNISKLTKKHYVVFLNLYVNTGGLKKLNLGLAWLPKRTLPGAKINCQEG
jgi:hypothetical protein